MSRQEKRGSERGSNLPEITQQARSRDLSYFHDAGLPSKEAEGWRKEEAKL